MTEYDVQETADIRYTISLMKMEADTQRALTQKDLLDNTSMDDSVD